MSSKRKPKRADIIREHVNIIARAIEECEHAGINTTQVARSLEEGCRTRAARLSAEQNSPVSVVLDCDLDKLNSFTLEYSASVYRICELLRDAKGELLRDLASGKVRPELVADMKVDDLCPSVLAHERAEYALRREQKIEYKTTTAYRCAKCGANDAHFFECQTRGSDECSTIFLTCKTCQHRWHV